MGTNMANPTPKLLLLALTILCLSLPNAVLAKGRFTYYPMLTPASFPCDNTYADPARGGDGGMWVEELVANKLARVDPQTGKVEEYDIPFSFPSLNVTLPIQNRAAASCALVTGFDGMLYASNGNRNQLVQLNFATKEVRVFDAPLGPLGNLQPLNDVTAAPDGIYFTQTTANSMVKFHYKSHKMERIPLPTPAALPLGIYYATDGAIWFLELAGNKVGRLNRTTRAIEEYPVPASLLGPVVMRAETKGRYLYFACTPGNSIGEIDMVTKAIKAYKVPTKLSTPVEVCNTKKGDVWFTHVLMNSLGRLRPSTGRIKEVTLPGTLNPGSPISVPQYVGSGIYCEPGRAIWATEATKNRAYRYQLRKGE